MPVERTSCNACLIDVLDRMLGKGLVIGAERSNLVASLGEPLDLTRVRLRVVVTSVRTYLDDEERTESVGPSAKPDHDHLERSQRKD
jgi:hypothetical protein